METKQTRKNKITKPIAVWILISLFILSGFGQVNYAHGGEDHGDEQPKVTTNEKGSVARSSRIGKLEVLVKHSLLEPDVATAGSMFITDYVTNAAFDKATVSIEIENASGTTTAVPSEKAGQAGIFKLEIPALPEGSYTMRVKLTYDGAADTATFSGVSIAPAGTEAAPGMSWLRGTLLSLTGAFVLILFAGLFFFVWRSADTGEIQREAISA